MVFPLVYQRRVTLEPSVFAARSGDLGSHTVPSIRNVGLGNDLMFFFYLKNYDMVHGYIYISHDGSMVLLYMVTWIPSIYPVHVSIYTSTMDPMGIYICMYMYMYIYYIYIYVDIKYPLSMIDIYLPESQRRYY